MKLVQCEKYENSLLKLFEGFIFNVLFLSRCKYACANTYENVGVHI